VAASSSTAAQVTDKIIILDVVSWLLQSINHIWCKKKKKKERKKENGVDKGQEKVSGYC
jgi:hypothetical protein